MRYSVELGCVAKLFLADEVHSHGFYCRWKEPLRHTLIRLRAQKPALFANRPIPLSEVEIKKDEAFTAILAQEVRALCWLRMTKRFLYSKKVSVAETWCLIHA